MTSLRGLIAVAIVSLAANAATLPDCVKVLSEIQKEDHDRP